MKWVGDVTSVPTRGDDGISIGAWEVYHELMQKPIGASPAGFFVAQAAQRAHQAAGPVDRMLKR